MQKIIVVAVFIVLLVPMSAMAQLIPETYAGEFEFGTNGVANQLQSHQYIFIDWKNANALIRPFWVEGVLNRIEFAAGPTFSIGNVLLKTETGVTTDDQWMLGNTSIFQTLGMNIVHIADGKIGSGGEGPTELYQKLFINLVGLDRVQFRATHLIVEGKQVFLRLGGEYRQPWVIENSHFFINPFRETKGRKWGTIVGLRFSANF